MPGSNARALEKAKQLDADGLILDLEDAVAPDAKAVAREQVCAAVKAGGYGHREVVIRINGLETDWGAEDLAAAVQAGADAIAIPKVSSAEDLAYVRQVLGELQAEPTALWAMLETPLAMLNAKEIALAASDPLYPVTVFVMGTNDLAKESGARFSNQRMAFLPWLMTGVAAARVAGVDVLDGVYNDFADLDGFAAECEQGADLGMNGKTLIHPKQIEAANRIFAPSTAEVEWAKKIIAAFELPESASKGAVQVEGKMVERLHAQMAERTVMIAQAIEGRGE
ncbi:CoA ester lyase [Rhodobacteraceae bacterium RKSG542]|nr:CoA ester lyase [Pseudovibrio flavus]